MNEDELVAAIRRVVAADAADVVQGIGDDAAVIRLGDRVGLLTTDMLVEGVDFDTRTASARDIGYRAVAVNLSDIAAMGGSPRYCLVGLAMPSPTDVRWVVELFAGMREAADEHAVAIVGGDLSSAKEVIVSITMTGEAMAGRGGVVLRAGAQPGDRLVVTGRLGAAAGGLALLGRGPRAVAAARAAGWGDDLLQAHLRPAARVGEGQALARAGATAMIDLSDGLAKDLARLCAASGVGASVSLDVVPVASGLVELEGAAGDEPLRLAMSGGDDYELLAAVPPRAVEGVGALLAERFGTPLTDIGQVRATAGVFAVDAGGTETPLEPDGWDHFAP